MKIVKTQRMYDYWLLQYEQKSSTSQHIQI